MNTRRATLPSSWSWRASWEHLAAWCSGESPSGATRRHHPQLGRYYSLRHVILRSARVSDPSSGAGVVTGRLTFAARVRSRTSPPLPPDAPHSYDIGVAGGVVAMPEFQKLFFPAVRGPVACLRLPARGEPHENARTHALRRRAQAHRHSAAPAPHSVLHPASHPPPPPPARRCTPRASTRTRAPTTPFASTTTP